MELGFVGRLGEALDQYEFPAPKPKVRAPRVIELDRPPNLREAEGEPCLYLLQVRGTDFHKIGIAHNVFKRRAAIQHANPMPVEIAATVPYGGDRRRFERYMHLFFRDYRVRPRCEWFELGDLQLGYFPFAADAFLRGKIGLMRDLRRHMRERAKELREVRRGLSA